MNFTYYFYWKDLLYLKIFNSQSAQSTKYTENSMSRILECLPLIVPLRFIVIIHPFYVQIGVTQLLGYGGLDTEVAVCCWNDSMVENLQ